MTQRQSRKVHAVLMWAEEIRILTKICDGLLAEDPGFELSAEEFYLLGEFNTHLKDLKIPAKRIRRKEHDE